RRRRARLLIRRNPMAQISEPLGDVATRVLFENERVKIWEMRLAPGEEGPLHRHERDHILVQIDGDRMAVVPHPTTKSPYGEYLEAGDVPRQVFFISPGGGEAYYELLIELKD